MKILHTADIYLREYEDDRWKMLQKLIEIGKKNIYGKRERNIFQKIILNIT